MEFRWAGRDRLAEARYRAALMTDLGHADAWVHVGNIRLELSPNDNQGVRFLLPDLEAGLTWEESAAWFAVWPLLAPRSRASPRCSKSAGLRSVITG